MFRFCEVKPLMPVLSDSVGVYDERARLTLMSAARSRARNELSEGFSRLAAARRSSSLSVGSVTGSWLVSRTFAASHGLRLYRAVALSDALDETTSDDEPNA